MKSTPVNRTQAVKVETRLGTITFRSIDEGSRFRVTCPDQPEIRIRQHRGSVVWFSYLKGEKDPVCFSSEAERAFKMTVRHYWK